MVRRATIVLSMIGLLWQTAACSSADSPNDGSSAQPPVASSPVPPSPSAQPVPPTAASATPKATPPRSRPTTTSPAAPAPGTPLPSGDVPGPLPWGARTLTGVVERSGDCTMLLVGQRRWALTGRAAAALSPGTKVTVRGNLATRPAGCGDRDLAQTVAVTRADPA